MDKETSQSAYASTSAHSKTEHGSRRSTLLPTPAVQDRRRGLLILLGAFVAYFITDGWSYSFGVFYPYLIDHFKQGKGVTAVIGALLYGLPLLLSPIVCALANVYSCRTVAICGGFLLGMYLIASSMAPSIMYLCIVTGVLGSPGMAMTYVPSLIIVTYYFEKRRGLATGLAVVGSGLGAFTFPVFVEYLTQVYGWRGMLLLLGAVAFHIVPSGMLYRPRQSSKRNENQSSEGVLPLNDANQQYKAVRSGYDLSQDKITNSLSQSTSALYAPRPASVSRRHCLTSYGSLEKTNDPINLSFHEKQHRSSCPELYIEVEYIKCEISSTESKNILIHTTVLTALKSEVLLLTKSMFNKSLVYNRPYLLFCVSSFILYLWIGIPYLYLVDKAMIMKIPVDAAAFLLSIIAIARTVGQVVMGYLGDHSQFDTVLLYGVVTAAAGLGTLLLPLCHTYSMLCVFATVFGFGVSVTYCLQMVILVQLVGLQTVTSAFGFLQLLQGIATLLGTPVAGWMFDLTGHYDHSFYAAGAWMLLSGLLLLPIPLMVRRQQNTDHQSST